MATAPDVYIVAGKRTPIGKERGALRAVPAWGLGAAAIEHALAGVDAGRVDRVVLGNVTNGGNVARIAALAAGLPPGQPAITVNNQCASGLSAVRLGVEAIVAGQADVVVAGGAESVSNAIVHLGVGSLRRRAEAAALPRIQHAPQALGDPEMGPATDALAAELGITRQHQDAYVLRSRARGHEASAGGVHAELIAALGAAGADEMAARSVSAGLLRRLRPAHSPSGTVTAGNSAPLGDGAAVVVLASRDAVESRNLRPLARVVATADAAVHPARTPLAAVAAAEAALARAGMQAASIHRWDVNEAYAAKAVAFISHFALDPAEFNVRGGALHYGHPFAASGAVCLLHLVQELRNSRTRFGLAAIAGAGGVGEAAVVEATP